MSESGGSRVQKGPALLLLTAITLAAGAAVIVPNADRLRSFLRPRAPDVVFVVMDTVRADHLHACGYERPNTPTLDALAQSRWAVHCSVTSPAPWTIPSHLSYFTGRSWVELQESGSLPATLAQDFQRRGYDTAFLSANMVLRKSEWFTNGFRQVEVARNFAELKGNRFPPRLAQILTRAEPDKPLFLFLNLVDAHSPYPPIPAGVEWAEPQRGIQHRRFSDEDDSPFKRYINGTMAPDEAQRYEHQLVAGYDYGIELTDQNVAQILDLLRQNGRLDRVRVVITSDHGELLGEHDVVGHGDTLYEPGLRVPLFYWDSLGTNPMPLPEQLNGLAVHDLVLDGKVGDHGVRYATSYEHMVGDGAWNGLALWPDDATKLVWRDGASYRIDLRADPGEEHPLPIEDQHPAKAEFDALVARNLKVIEATKDFQDEETLRMLRQAGYIE